MRGKLSISVLVMPVFIFGVVSVLAEEADAIIISKNKDYKFRFAFHPAENQFIKYLQKSCI